MNVTFIPLVHFLLPYMEEQRLYIPFESVQSTIEITILVIYAASRFCSIIKTNL
jgi:hypothetical protein